MQVVGYDAPGFLSVVNVNYEASCQLDDDYRSLARLCGPVNDQNIAVAAENKTGGGVIE